MILHIIILFVDVAGSINVNTASSAVGANTGGSNEMDYQTRYKLFYEYYKSQGFDDESAQSSAHHYASSNMYQGSS